MSGHGDPHDEAHGDEEHEHDDDHHAPPALPEPATPLWLTLVGVGLFLAAAIAFVATRDEGKTVAELSAATGEQAEGEAEAAAAPTPVAAPNRPAPPSRPAARPQQPGHEGHDHD